MIQFDSQFADGLETTNYFLTKSLVVEMLKIIDNLGILECIKLRSTISSSGHGWNTINSFNDKSKALSSPVPILQPIYPLWWKAILIWICHGHQEAFIFEIRYHWNPRRGSRVPRCVPNVPTLQGTNISPNRTQHFWVDGFPRTSVPLKRVGYEFNSRAFETKVGVSSNAKDLPGGSKLHLAIRSSVGERIDGDRHSPSLMAIFKGLW